MIRRGGPLHHEGFWASPLTSSTLYRNEVAAFPSSEIRSDLFFQFNNQEMHISFSQIFSGMRRGIHPDCLTGFEI